ncbi:hypothetical protein GCM10025795_50890 [Verticiella sediminum]
MTPLAGWTAGEADERPAVDQMLQALASTDHAGFVARGTPEFAAIPQAQFGEVAAQVGPALKAGYELQRLGDIRRGGQVMGVWKVTPGQGADDWLATVSMTPDGRVSGFFLR